MFEAVNVLTHNHHHILSIYILPIYSLTYAELFTTVEEKIYQHKIFDKYDKENF